MPFREENSHRRRTSIYSIVNGRIAELTTLPAKEAYPASTIRLPSDGLMLGQRLRR